MVLLEKEKGNKLMDTMYCDDCGERYPTSEMYHYEHVPWDVDSALAGESASICDTCDKKNWDNARKASN